MHLHLLFISLANVLATPLNLRSVSLNVRSVSLNGRSKTWNAHSVTRNGDFNRMQVSFHLWSKCFEITFAPLFRLSFESSDTLIDYSQIVSFHLVVKKTVLYEMYCCIR